ncbi:MAG: hypothetical protein NC209_05480 [Alistipes sp.]|nr:hypothetical protein [Alistipes senegalensis]MCM1250576.1 hypothetical protein [Alistipes sp.]
MRGKLFFGCRIAVLLLLCVGMSSCRRAAEKAREKIRIEAVEQVEMHGLTALDLVLRVRNDSGYKLRVEHAALDIFYGTTFVAGAVLREPLFVPRRTTQSLATQWRLRLSDPLAAYALVRRLRRDDISAVSVSFAVAGQGGPAAVNISRERVPLSEFLNTFDLDLQQLKNYFQE